MKTKWKIHYFCEGCAQRLSIREVLYSQGTCPRCGYLGMEAVTIVAHVRKAARWVSGSWWRFWIGRWEYRLR